MRPQSLCWLMRMLPPELITILMSFFRWSVPFTPSCVAVISWPRRIASVHMKLGIEAFTGLLPRGIPIGHQSVPHSSMPLDVPGSPT